MVHNFVRTVDEIIIQDSLNIVGFIDIAQDTSGPTKGTSHSIQSRNKLADYFISDMAASLGKQIIFNYFHAI